MSDSKFTTHGDEPVEARIVAWVLGEASAFEAEELERLCEERPELAVFKRRIEAVHGLTTEAHNHKEDARWKLSIKKRAAIEELIGAEEETAEDLARDLRAGRSGRRAMLAIAACLVMTLVVATLTWPVIFARKKASMDVGAETESMLMELSDADEDGFSYAYQKTDNLQSNKEMGKKLKQHKAGESVADSISSRAPAENAIPVPEVTLAKPSLDFGTDKDMGEGWASGSGIVVDEKNRLAERGRKAPSRVDAPTPPAASTPKVLGDRAGYLLEEAEVASSYKALEKESSKGSDGRRSRVNLSLPPAKNMREDNKAEKDQRLTAKDPGANYSDYSDANIKPRSQSRYYRDEGLEGGRKYNAPAPAGAPSPEPMAPEDKVHWANGSLGPIPGQGEGKGKGEARAERDDLNGLREFRQRGDDFFGGIAGGPSGKGVTRGKFKNKPGITNQIDELAEVDAFEAPDLDDVQTGTTASLTHAQLAKKLDAGKLQLEMRKLVEASEIELQSQTEKIDEEARFTLIDEAVQKYEVLKADPNADPAELKELEEVLTMKVRATVSTTEDKEERKRPVVTGEEIIAADEPYSTFSLNINDASFRVAQAALAKGEMPDPEGIKVEQFYNAVDYGDPAPAQGQPVAGSIEQTAHPVIPGRNLVRVAVKTASEGRNQGQPLRLTLLIDQSGSMAREDRRQAMVDALEGLRELLNEHDQVNVIGFSRTPRLLAEAVNGKEGQLANLVNIEANEGGTNLEEALKLGEQLAERHQLEGAQNRMVLFTDGAANLGDADPDSLSDKIKELRQKGISFDIAGIVADGLNDDLLGEMARHGNGRYYVVGKGGKNRFAEQLAGAFSPAAENVKVQVHFNPERVGRYKLIGFEKDRLNKEDFHDDTVDAAEMAAEEAGVAIYQVETLPEGEGEIGEVSVRFRDVASGEMVERSWTIANEISTAAIDQARPSMQLATLAMLAGQKLKGGPLADAVNFNDMGEVIAKVNQHYKGDPKAAEMLEMIEQLK